MCAYRSTRPTGRPSTLPPTPFPTSSTTVLMLGPTIMPGFLMPRFYARVAARLSRGGLPIEYRPMPEFGGLGRTDHVVDHFRPRFEEARARGERLRIAGHSLGGIVAWVLSHEYPDVVDLAELWCAPIRGTALGGVSLPVPEARFLARTSRFLKRYDHPIHGPLVRAIYTPVDQLAIPARDTCFIMGSTVENHMVMPFRPPARYRRPHQWVHVGLGEHVLLPRSQWLNRRLALHDAQRHHPAGGFGRPAAA